LYPLPIPPEPTGVQTFEKRFPFIDVTNIRAEEKVIFIVAKFIGTPDPNDTNEDVGNAILALIKPYERPGHINVVIKFIRLGKDQNYEFYVQNTSTIEEMKEGIHTNVRSASISGPVDKVDLRWKN
jgi:hypothetical protein